MDVGEPAAAGDPTAIITGTVAVTNGCPATATADGPAAGRAATADLAAQQQIQQERLVQQMVVLLQPPSTSNTTTPGLLGDNPSHRITCMACEDGPWR